MSALSAWLAEARYDLEVEKDRLGADLDDIQPLTALPRTRGAVDVGRTGAQVRTGPQCAC
jgi:hypothetical protein